MRQSADVRRRLQQLWRRLSRSERDDAADALRVLLPKLRSWSQAIDASTQWMAKTAGEITDLSPGTPALMKLVHNTWMPLHETHFSAAVSEAGEYQIDTYRRSLAHVSSRRVALDIGANIGLWARQMCRDFDLVHAFEPQPLARACLQRNVTDQNCILYPFAVGAERGVLPLVINPLAIGNARIDPDRKGSAQATIVPLDSLSLGAVDYLKIDVQGFESQVLDGARDLLTRERPVVVIEVERAGGSDAAVIAEKMGALGYEQVDKVRKDAIFARTRA